MAMETGSSRGQQRRLLIAGIPGTGKTTIGDYLRDTHGFAHVDAEAELSAGRAADAIIAQFLGLDDPAVITWGFIPGHDDHAIESLLANGTIMVWLDGNRVAARRHWKRAKPGLPEYLFDNQISRIDTNAIPKYGPIARHFDTFDANGDHLPVERIARWLLRLTD